MKGPAAAAYCVALALVSCGTHPTSRPRYCTPPAQQLGKHLALALLGEAVVDARRHGLVHNAGHNTVGFKVAQFLNQHLLRDFGHEPAQFAVAPGLVEEVEQNEQLPLAAQHVERGAPRTDEVAPKRYLPPRFAEPPPVLQPPPKVVSFCTYRVKR